MQRLHEPVYRTRIRELVRLVIQHLRESDRVLDVGCGFGALGRAILDSNACPENVTIRGLERVQRDQSHIEIDTYDGSEFPYEESSFDVVILADVLHHETDPEHLISECIRVSRRLLIIKDHKINGFLAKWRISLIDWAANAPYGVPCLYRYSTPKQWDESHARHNLSVEYELNSMKLYPPFVNLLLGRRLQYFAVLKIPQPLAA